MKVRKRRLRVWWVRAFFLLVALPLLGVSPYIGIINNPNENVRTYMTMAIVEDHTFRIDGVVRRFGWINDMARVPAHGKEPDHVYSLKGPAVSYAGLPVYWAFRKIAIWRGHAPPSETWKPDEREWWLRTATFTLRLFVVQVPCFFFLVWFERYLRTVTSDLSLRLSAVAAAGLGTNYIAYAQAYVSHALVAVAAFLAFALTETELRLVPQQRSKARAFWAGAFCGLATMLEYPAFPISVILAVWGLCAFYRPSRLALFVLGGMIDVLALMFFQWRCFGSPLSPGYKLAETQAFAVEHAKGLFGIVKPQWEAFKELSIDKGFGFFGTSPYMWLGLLAVPLALVFTFGSPHLRRIRRGATLVWLLTMLSLWLVIGGYLQWRGGWTVGPRFFGAAPPFFAFGATCALEKLARIGPFTRALSRGIAGGLAVASVITIGFVSLVYNTLPPDLLRPLADFALPLARAGFVAHHVMEWVGWNSPAFWYVAAIALVAAPFFAAVTRGKARALPYVTQVSVAALACWVALRPQFAGPKPGEPAERYDLRPFVLYWEPHGRDRIASLRSEAERVGPRQPCLWYRVADLEELLGLHGEALRDGQRAATPLSKCPKRLIAF